MRKLVASTALLSAAEAGATVFTVIQTRYLAGMLGPAGFGVFGLLTAFFRLVSAYGTTWTSTSTTRWVARYVDEGDDERASQVFSLSLSMTALIMLPLAAILALLVEPVTRVLLDGEVGRGEFLIYTGVVCVTAFRGSLMATIQGLVQTRWLAGLRIGGGALQLATVVAFVAWIGLPGWFLGLFFPAAMGVGVGLLLVLRHSPLRLVRPVFRGSAARGFFRYSSVDLALALVVTAGEYVQRLIILRALGLESVGLLQAALTLVLYLDIANRSAMTYLLPSMSGRDMADVFRRVDEFTQLAVHLSAGLAVGTVLFGGLATDILLGSEFEALGESLPYFAGYFLLSAVHNPSATAVMGLAHLRVHALAAVATLSVSTALLLALTGPLGFTAVPLAMAGGQVAGYVIRFGFIWQLGQRLSTRSWVLHAVALGLFAAAFAVRDASFAVRALALLGTAGVLLAFVPGLLRQTAAQRETPEA